MSEKDEVGEKRRKEEKNKKKKKNMRPDTFLAFSEIKNVCVPKGRQNDFHFSFIFSIFLFSFVFLFTPNRETGKSKEV